MSTDLSQIRDYLYLGASISAVNLSVLQSQGITRVLNTAMEIDNFHESTSSIEYLKLELDDEMDVKISDHFEKCFNFISKVREEEGKKVLVHCQAGISRSATIVIAYLMFHDKISLKDAFFHTKKCRHQIGPNLGFFKELMKFETSLFSLPTATFSYEDYCICSLVQMGFDEETSRSAVSQSEGRIDLAINFVLLNS